MNNDLPQHPRRDRARDDERVPRGPLGDGSRRVHTPGRSGVRVEDDISLRTNKEKEREGPGGTMR